MSTRAKQHLVSPQSIAGEVIGLAAVVGVTAVSLMDRVEQDVRILGLCLGVVLTSVLIVKGFRDLKRTRKQDDP